MYVKVTINDVLHHRVNCFVCKRKQNQMCVLKPLVLASLMRSATVHALQLDLKHYWTLSRLQNSSEMDKKYL